MKNSIKIIVWIVMTVVYSCEYTNAQTTLRTLFIGNSYTSVNNLPQLVHDVAVSAGDSLIFDSNTPGGYRLIDHSTNSISQNKIANGNWDYVVIQGQSQEPIMQYNDFVNGAISLRDQIYQVDSCTVVMPYMTWGRKNGDAANCPNFPVMCTYERMDSALKEEYLDITQQANGVVSPVSVVWRYIRNNHPNIELYQNDESHPSAAGSYAAACCFYAALFKKDPTSISYDFGLSSSDAAIIRNAAKVEVYDSLGKWDYKKPAEAKIRVSKGSGPNQMNFFAQHSGIVIQNYRWDFGDGASSGQQHPTHTYASNGSYTVSLTTENCYLQNRDTAFTDTVIQLCSHTPTIYASNPWLCNFDTLWTQPASSYQWYSGNKAISGANNRFLPNYAQYNNWSFTIVTTSNGCSELSEPYSPQPKGTGYYFDALGDPCEGDTVEFAVLHISTSLSGFEIIRWYRNDTLLSQNNDEDTLFITKGGAYEVRVVDTTSNCPQDTAFSYVEYDCNVVTNRQIQTPDPGFVIYPNPVHELLKLKFSPGFPGGSIRVYSIRGRLMKEIRLKGNPVELDVSDIPPGLYYIHVPGNKKVKKMIKY